MSVTGVLFSDELMIAMEIILSIDVAVFCLWMRRWQLHGGCGEEKEKQSISSRLQPTQRLRTHGKKVGLGVFVNLY